MKIEVFKTALVAFVAGCLAIVSAVAVACPFCDAPSQTLSEETAAADAVVLAKLIKEAPTSSDPNNPTVGAATFEIIEVLRGKETLGDAKQVEAVYFGETDKKRTFLISGLRTEKLDWTTPLPLSEAAVDYVRKLPSLSPSGADRLAFFQGYLENDDPLLAQDSYDEFARAPYDEVLALAPRMHHDKLVQWIADLEINPSRRRLYLTMLSACGTKDDLPLLESMIVSDFSKMEPELNGIVATGLAMRGPLCLPGWVEAVQQRERQKKLGLDALVACYLKMRGPEGLDLIDERFLKDPKVDYTHIYSTIMALRFHGDQNTGVLPKDRLLKSMRLLLDNPDFADQVVLDLSRWEDWSVLDRLVKMFKESDKKGYVRQPVVTYLTVAAEQPGDVGTRATAALAELEQFDPETVKQARSLMAFGALSRAKPSPSAAVSGGTDAKTASDAKATTDTQAFAATAADDETDPATIADPAAYEQAPPTKAVPADGEGVAAIVGAADTEPVNPTAAPSVAVQTARQADSDVARQSSGSAVESTPTPNMLLIVGAPLLAAGVLLGVYWLILRTGAM